MPSRYLSRRQALQVLYLWDIRHVPVEEAISQYFSPLSVEGEESLTEPTDFAVELACGVAAAQAEIDNLIRGHCEHWRLERMAVVDRNILRLAAFEMSRLGTHPALVIDQALNLARRFSSDESVTFINGVLDAIRRHLQQPGAAAEPPLSQ